MLDLRRWINEFGRDKFEHFIYQNDRRTDRQYSPPLRPVERCDYEQRSEERNVEDREVQAHAQRDRGHQERILPQRQHQERLILRQRVHGVEHLDGYQDRQTHGRSPLR